MWNLAYNTAIFYYSQIIMKFIVKLFPEIMIKSETVRKRFAKILTSNIRNILQKYDEETAVVRHWDYIEVRSKNEANREELIALLQRIPGSHHFLEVEEKPFTDLHHIFELTLADVADQLENKTFCVRVKRKGNMILVLLKQNVILAVV